MASRDPMTSPFTYDVTCGMWTLGEDLARLHGLSADTVVTTQVLVARIHGEDRAEMLARFERHLQHPGAYSCAYRMTDAQGRARRLRLVGNSLATAAGQVFRLEGFVLDIGADISRWQGQAVAASAAHRATIEQAKGALMLTFGVDEDNAFRMLVGYSQHANVKLRDLAALIVETVSSPLHVSIAERAESLQDLLTPAVNGV